MEKYSSSRRLLKRLPQKDVPLCMASGADFILSLPIAANDNSRPELVHVRPRCDRQKFVNL